MSLNAALQNVANNANPASLANTFRRRRFKFFENLLDNLRGDNQSRPIQLLDVGGTAGFWNTMGPLGPDVLQITLLNLGGANNHTAEGYRVVEGDGRDMRVFADKSFDIVFSNSVIEHVGTFADQQRMAHEVQRVGKRYFVQTPNRYFPIEPHFLFPFFQFLPESLQVWMLMHRDLGWFKKTADKEDALRQVRSVRLMSERELKRLFPGANVYREKIGGMTKSLTAYAGW